MILSRLCYELLFFLKMNIYISAYIKTNKKIAKNVQKSIENQSGSIFMQKKITNKAPVDSKQTIIESKQ